MDGVMGWRRVGNRWWIGAALALFAIVAVSTALLAWSGDDGGTDGEDAAGGQRSAAAETLYVVVGGVPRIAPAVVPLTGDLSATVTLSDGSESYGRTLDVGLLRGEAEAVAVDGATIRGTVSMELMEHERIDVEAVAAGDGRYRLPLDLTMAGDWQIELEIVTSQEQATLVLTFSV